MNHLSLLTEKMNRRSGEPGTAKNPEFIWTGRRIRSEDFKRTRQPIGGLQAARQLVDGMVRKSRLFFEKEAAQQYPCVLVPKQIIQDWLVTMPVCFRIGRGTACCALIADISVKRARQAAPLRGTCHDQPAKWAMPTLQVVFIKFISQSIRQGLV